MHPAYANMSGGLDHIKNVYVIDKSGNYLSINLTKEQEPKIIKKKKII